MHTFKNIPIFWAEKEIPKGIYCYNVISITNEGKIHAKTCPFWFLRTKEVGYCSLLKKSDDDLDSFGLLWDQVKECGINDEDDYTDSIYDECEKEIAYLPVKIKKEL